MKRVFRRSKYLNGNNHEEISLIHALATAHTMAWEGPSRQRVKCAFKLTGWRYGNGAAYYCSGQEPRTSPEYVPPGGTQTPTLGQASVYEVDDQTSSNPTVSRGSLAPPRHPRRGRGLGLVDALMIDETFEV